jgi:hypothetical protein
VSISADGALMGSCSHWLHEPGFGWELTKALPAKPSLPPAGREVAVLSGAHVCSTYELCAHVPVASGLSDDKLAAVVAS